jgi:cytochrome c biogenesis protein CcdA
MKKFLFLFFIFISFYSFAADKLTVTLFYSPHCKACVKLKKEFLPSVKEKYQNKIQWLELNIDNSQRNLALLFSVAARFEKKAVTPSILVGDTFLTGVKEIENGFEKAIKVAMERKHSILPFPKINLMQIFKGISVFTIIGSGLIDGINPCAFAVIVFFVSFLAVYGYRKREVIYVGLSYCMAVFITYLLIGLGFFNFLYSLSKIYILIKSFYYLVAAFCFFLFGLAVADYFKFRKKRKPEDLILQLPAFLKKRINIVIGSRLREKRGRSIFSLIISSFIIGFLVSILEAVCTGQVYIPTIAFILKNTNLRFKALTYLVIYNLMFIFPLIVVFSLSLLGFTSQKFNAFLRKNLGRVKIVMAFLFLILGIFILVLS